MNFVGTPWAFRRSAAACSRSRCSVVSGAPVCTATSLLRSASPTGDAVATDGIATLAINPTASRIRRMGETLALLGGGCEERVLPQAPAVELARGKPRELGRPADGGGRGVGRDPARDVPAELRREPGVARPR